MTREFSRGLLTLCACTELHTSSGRLQAHVLQIPSKLKGSSLPLGCHDSFKLHFSSPSFPATSPISILLTSVIFRRIKRWIFSWPVLNLAWHNCETRICDSVSHSYLPLIDLITMVWAVAFTSQISLHFRSICHAPGCHCFLKELSIFYTIKVKFFYTVFAQILNLIFDLKPAVIYRIYFESHT